MADHPFLKKKTSAKPVAGKTANDSDDPKTVEKKAIPFTDTRREEHLHTAQINEPKPKAKSFSFYAEDFARVESLRRQLSPRSSKRVSDSVVVRVALVYLEEHLKEKEGSPNFEKLLRNLLLVQS
jgi:hypothetical protein